MEAVGFLRQQIRIARPSRAELGRIHIDHEGNGGVERSEFGAADRLRIAEPGLEALGETQPGRRVRQGVGLGSSEEHTSDIRSLMRTSYAVFCVQKQTHE